MLFHWLTDGGSNLPRKGREEEECKLVDLDVNKAGFMFYDVGKIHTNIIW